MNNVRLPKLSLQVSSSQRGLQRVESMLGSMKNIWNLSEDTFRRIKNAVTEAVKNAILQNKSDESKTVTIGMRCAGNAFEFTVQDESREAGHGNCVKMTFNTGSTGTPKR